MSKEKKITKEEIESLIKKRLFGKDIANQLGITRRTLYNKMEKFGLRLDTSPRFNVNVFDIIDCEEKAYWLGFLYADGYVSSIHKQVEISLKGEDIGHLIKFSKFLQDDRKNPVKVSKVRIGEKSFSRCRYIIGDDHFHQRLCELGCIPKKSLTLTFPDKNIFTDESLIYDFIRGYVDGDGSLSNTSTGRLQIDIIGTVDFLTSIKEIFPEFGGIYTDKRNHNVHSIVCSANNADRIAKRLYETATIYLDRKYKKFAALCKNSETSGKNGEGCDS